LFFQTHGFYLQYLPSPTSGSTLTPLERFTPPDLGSVCIVPAMIGTLDILRYCWLCVWNVVMWCYCILCNRCSVVGCCRIFFRVIIIMSLVVLRTVASSLLTVGGRSLLTFAICFLSLFFLSLSFGHQECHNVVFQSLFALSPELPNYFSAFG
jgi:hypothetical protein